MNLQSKLHPQLWMAIENSHQRGVYKAAILDAMHFLSDVIREKANLQGDGVDLVSSAFCSKTSPLLKINKYQTKDEKNEQDGFSSILRGLYQYIRNPRSHQQGEDSQAAAESIILFLNFLLQELDDISPVFTIDNWLKSVFDPVFVFTEKYVKLIVAEIPRKKLLDSLIVLFRARVDQYSESMKLVSAEIISELTEEEIQDFAKVVSEELKEIVDEESLLNLIKILPPEL